MDRNYRQKPRAGREARRTEVNPVTKKTKSRIVKAKKLKTVSGTNHMTGKIAILLFLGTFLMLGFAGAVLTFTLYRPLWIDESHVTTEPSHRGHCDVHEFEDVHHFEFNSTEININDDVMAYLSRPTSCFNKAAVVILHDQYGYTSEDSRSLADDFGMHGYISIVPDLFRGRSLTNESTLQEFSESLNTSLIEDSMDVTLTYLRKELRVQKIGMVGFSWGGRRVALFATPKGKIQAGVIFYGFGITPVVALSMQTPVLLIYAQNDTMIPVSDVYANEELLRAANRLLPSIDADDSGLNGSPVCVEIFDDVGHGFINDQNNRSVEVAAEAISDTRVWFERYLFEEENVF